MQGDQGQRGPPGEAGPKGDKVSSNEWQPIQATCFLLPSAGYVDLFGLFSGG